MLPNDEFADPVLPHPPVFWTSDAVAAPLTPQPIRSHPGVTPAAAAPGTAAASKLRALALSHPGG